MPVETRITLYKPAGEDANSPPAWAEGEQPSSDFWYFVNELGEQWIARRFGNELVISGLDIDWEEIRISADEASAVLRPFTELGKVGTGSFVIKDVVVHAAEAFWMLSVLQVAFASSR